MDSFTAVSSCWTAIDNGCALSYGLTFCRIVRIGARRTAKNRQDNLYAPLLSEIEKLLMTVLSTLQDCAATIEALIFASDRPVREREMEAHLPDGITVSEVITLVAARYDETSGIELCQIADGWAFRTKADFGERLSQHKRVERPLSRAALEVLAIIAYHQPITRAEIEKYVALAFSKGTMDILLELGWVKPRGGGAPRADH